MKSPITKTFSHYFFYTQGQSTKNERNVKDREAHFQNFFFFYTGIYSA
jgi:hypothetical protein